MGHYGYYNPSRGFKQDFYPYDQTLNEYKDTIKAMKSSNYIYDGKTRMVDIDF